MHPIYVKVFTPSAKWHPDAIMYWKLVEIDAQLQTQILFNRCNIG